jgi:hypothetical protein
MTLARRKRRVRSTGGDDEATGTVKGTRLSLFVAADDADARTAVATLGFDLGFDAIDAGPLANARWLESLGYLDIQLGYISRWARTSASCSCIEPASPARRLDAALGDLAPSGHPERSRRSARRTISRRGLSHSCRGARPIE